SLKALNESVGEPVEVSAEMYKALETLQRAGAPAERVLFLAPVNSIYSSVFFSQSDEEAAKVDPYRSADSASVVRELSAFFSDSDHVRIELEGGCRARLVVSDSYAAFAKANGVGVFAELSWLENSLIVDYVADGLIENGFRLGSIASYDGISRDLNADGGYAQVFIKQQPTLELDRSHYYVYADGTVRHCYLRPDTGLCAEIPRDFGEKVPGAENSCFDIAVRLAGILLK
ncbi:MAG: hypothetical protein IKX89_04995, partial [Firmicutes bacterium]|nr:hypothetical protein [Bacillota bacterium]